MTAFRLTMQGAKTSRDLIYNVATSDMRWADTQEPVDLSRVNVTYGKRDHATFAVVSPDNPGKKSARPVVLKIQLGLKCNYACSYCNQAGQPQEDQGDALAFLSGLDSWLAAPPRRVEFWGGEPFAYWKTLRPLAESLRSRWPSVRFSIVTNGSLLDDEKIEWLRKMAFSVCISHDGPGHKNARGPDPFDDPVQAAAIRKAAAILPLGFNCVLTRDNKSLDEIRSWIAERLGIPPKEVVLNTEELLLPYDLGGLAMSPMKKEEYEAIHDQVFNDIVGGMARDVVQVRSKINDFFSSIASRRPVTALGQKCGMDREDSLAVDLKGNAITCQNTSASTKHRMGNVNDFDAIRLTQAHHFATRPECMACPVVQLCQGACMFLEGPLFEQACANSYTYNTAVLKAALWFLTGSLLVGLSQEEAVS